MPLVWEYCGSWSGARSHLESALAQGPSVRELILQHMRVRSDEGASRAPQSTSTGRFLMRGHRKTFDAGVAHEFGWMAPWGIPIRMGSGLGRKA